MLFDICTILITLVTYITTSYDSLEDKNDNLTCIVHCTV